jgi:hypothetical protein
MTSKSDMELARQLAAETLDVLSTPIAGVPSVRVVHRANAIRLLAAAYSAFRERRTCTDLDDRLPHEQPTPPADQHRPEYGRE